MVVFGFGEMILRTSLCDQGQPLDHSFDRSHYHMCFQCVHTRTNRSELYVIVDYLCSHALEMLYTVLPEHCTTSLGSQAFIRKDES